MPKRPPLVVLLALLCGYASAQSLDYPSVWQCDANKPNWYCDIEEGVQPAAKAQELRSELPEPLPARAIVDDVIASLARDHRDLGHENLLHASREIGLGIDVLGIADDLRHGRGEGHFGKGMGVLDAAQAAQFPEIFAERQDAFYRG